MAEGIDLRKYIDVLLKHRKLIGAVTLLAAVAALVVSLMLPPTYQATAICVATNPRYQMEFDPKFQSVLNLQVPAKAYISIARNASLEKQTIAALGDTIPAELRSIEALDTICSTTPGSDPSVIQLRVRWRVPQVVADIANTWARQYVQQIGALYGQSTDDLERIQEEVASAERNLQNAERDYIEFQKINMTSVLSETIKAQSKALADHMAAESNIELALQDAESLLQQLRASNQAAPNLASRLSALFTQLNALGAQRNLGAQIQLSLEASAVSEASVAAQVQNINILIDALRAKVLALIASRADIPSKILRAQGELQQMDAEQNRLLDARDVARETYLALARKQVEVRIASRVEPTEVRIVAPAEVPVRPVSPNKLLNVALGGALGLMLGIVVAFVLDYLKGAL